MAGKSITETSVALTANAQQFVAEFKRADNESRRSASAIDKEVDRLTKGLKRKFGAADFGRDLLRGFGIGSGFAVAEKAAELISGYWERAAKAAQEIEASTDNQLKSVQALVDLHRTDEQRLEFAIKEQARLQRAVDEANRPKIVTTPGHFGAADRGPRIFIPARTTTREMTGEEVAARDKLTEQLKAQAVVVEALRIKTNKAADEQLVKLAKLADGLGKQARDYDGIEEAEVRGAKALQDWNEELDRSADKYRALADPMLKYTKQFEEIDNLQRLGALTAAEATAAHAALVKEMNAPLDKAIKDLGDEADQVYRDMQDQATGAETAALDFANSLHDAFEESIIQGKSLGTVLADLGRSILSTFLKLAVINPVLNGLFGGVKGFKSLPSLFGFAAGGEPPVGVPSLVGENGPELFVPKTAGTIVPNHALPAAGKAGGGTYFIDARGADRTGLARLEAMIRSVNGSIENRALGAVADFRRRGASFA